MSEEKIKNIISAMEELLEDMTVPKNVKIKIEKAIASLNNKDEVSIRVNKALNELDDIGDDNNIEPYTRTQIWNIVSSLETI